jgi:hypothetical protein
VGLATKTRSGQVLISHDLAATARHGLLGCIDRLDDQGLAGWVVDTRHPARSQPISVLLDGVEIFAGSASTPRGDVSEMLGRGAACGFAFRWRDVSPRAPLAPPERRGGELLALTGGEYELSWQVPLDAAAVYERVEFYARRLALVMGVSHMASPIALDDRALAATEFDEVFYLAMYPQTRNSENSALDHFLTEGWKLGLDPNPSFSVRYYLQAHPDIAAAAVNPFVHYLRAGRAEGRLTLPPAGFRLDTLREQKTLEQVVTLWRRTDTFRALSARSLSQRLHEHLAGRRVRGLAVVFSHDDYTKSVGGIQLCLAKEERAFADGEHVYLHLSPWQALPVLAPGGAATQLPLRVICDGKAIGYALAGEVLRTLATLREAHEGVPASLVVHALHGLTPEFVAQTARVLRPQRSYFWLHDYFSVCTGYNLLRNQIQFCDAPPPDSAACAVCHYGESRPGHLERIATLFRNVRFTAVAPSRHVAELWRRASDLPVEQVLVHGHCTLAEDGVRIAGPIDRELGDGEGALIGSIRVAFLGHPTVHKGWPVFRDLVRRFCSDRRYELWHLGSPADEALPVRFREVKVSPADPDAMVKALDGAGIDVVVQWSIWPETFGIAARECEAAGAFLVTSSASGAVAEHAARPEVGLALPDEAALYKLFEGDELVERVADRRSGGVPVGGLRWSRLSADFAIPQPGAAPERS